MQNYLGNSKSCDSNVILFPGINSRSAGGRLCQTDDNNVFANQYFHSNYCVTSPNAGIYTFSGCSPNNVNTTTFHTYNNRHFTSGFPGLCGFNSWAAWQAAGQDAGSSLSPQPSLADMIQAGIDVLSGN